MGLRVIFSPAAGVVRIEGITAGQFRLILLVQCVVKFNLYIFILRDQVCVFLDRNGIEASVMAREDESIKLLDYDQAPLISDTSVILVEQYVRSSIFASEVSRQDSDSVELCAPSEFST